MTQYATGGTLSMVPNSVLPAALWPGDETYLFGTAPLVPGIQQKPNDSNVVAETVTVGEASISVAFAPRPSGGAIPGVSVLLVASANPGVCEFDLQTANVDADGAYALPGTGYKITVWVAAAGGQFVAQLPPQVTVDRFARLICVTNPNSVKFTGKIVYV